MTHDPRPHIHRRGHAIGRLRSLTTGAAIAGVAGTAGFGLLAAATWSGTATAVDQVTDGTIGADGAGDNDGATGVTRPKVAPNTGQTGQQPTTQTPRVHRGSGAGHASTGGSH